MKNHVDEKKNLTKKIDVMMKTARMREKQLAVNIEGRIKEQQKRMIEDFFSIMKMEIQTTCDQARAIRKENVQRDATEKKLIAVIMAQEQYIQEMRDKSMAWDINQLKQIAQMAPISNGGAISHSATISSMKMRLSMDPVKEIQKETKKPKKSSGIDLLEELTELVPVHQSMY